MAQFQFHSSKKVAEFGNDSVSHDACIVYGNPIKVFLYGFQHLWQNIFSFFWQKSYMYHNKHNCSSVNLCETWLNYVKNYSYTGFNYGDQDNTINFWEKAANWLSFSMQKLFF